MKENQDRNIQNVYRQIVEISKKYQVKKVVLFGSRARGTNMPKSDIDLAIYGCADFGGLSDSLNEDLWSLLKLDIINMDDKYVSSELVSEIEKDGVVLYEKVLSSMLDICRCFVGQNRKMYGWKCCVIEMMPHIFIMKKQHSNWLKKFCISILECLSRWNSRSVPGMEMRC